MFVIEDKGGAIALMLASLLFLGTWPAVLTLLEQRGRLPQHTYLDYSITNFLAAVFIALTFGQIGDGKPNMPNFITQLGQDNWPSILFAMAGGVFLSLGNLSTQYAWAFVGLSVTEVIASSITVVIVAPGGILLGDLIILIPCSSPCTLCIFQAPLSRRCCRWDILGEREAFLDQCTTINYFLDDRINKAEVLFPGVGCFLIAVFIGSVVHSSNAADNRKKLSSTNYKSKASSIEEQEPCQDTESKDKQNDMESGIPYVSNSDVKEEKAKAGTAEYLIELENRRSIKVFGSKTFLGLGIVFFAGTCFSLFSPAFNLATNDQWHTLKEGVPHLVVYTAFFYFSISCFALAVALNICFLYKPMLGLPKSSFTAYLNDWRNRKWAFLAGLLSGFGNGLQFMGGQAAGYAAADAVQALPLVSTFWGIILFGEYRRSSRKTYVLLVSMLFMFIIAVAILMASSGHRKTSKDWRELLLKIKHIFYRSKDSSRKREKFADVWTMNHTSFLKVAENVHT